MKFTKNFLCSMLIVVFVCNIITTRSLLSIADWTIHVYVQSKNNLNKFAIKNLNDMAAIGSTKNFNILVQWYQLHQQGVWRYKIEKNKIVLDTYLPTNTDGNGVDDLVDSCKWAVSKYPAKKYFLVLWNHGFGIIDPIWGRLRGTSTISPLFFNNPRAHIAGITKGFDLDLDTNRAILFNETTKTYMNNQSFVKALSRVKKEVLKNKKIDVLGMDACLMAMLEVAYQAREYADYMVASQEVELAHGWDYFTILSGLAGKGSNFGSADLAKSIVLAYENFYKGKIRFYTQSAVDLKNIVHVKDNVDQISAISANCSKYDYLGFKSLVKEARRKTLQFSSRNYVDLYSFYSEFYKILDLRYVQQIDTNAYVANLEQSKRVLLVQNVKTLKGIINTGKKLIENAVLANVTGSRLSVAKGLSIYFPTGKVDHSYVQTDFAKDGLWLKFLQQSF